MKKYTYGIVALLFSLVLLAGCTTGTNGNPTELTGTWKSSTTTKNVVTTSTTTIVASNTLVVSDDGSYTMTSVSTTTYASTTATVTMTEKYVYTGSLTGYVSGDEKFVTMSQTGYTHTVAYSPASAGTAVNEDITAASTATYNYYLSGTKLAFYNISANYTMPVFTKS